MPLNKKLGAAGTLFPINTISALICVSFIVLASSDYGTRCQLEDSEQVVFFSNLEVVCAYSMLLKWSFHCKTCGAASAVHLGPAERSTRGPIRRVSLLHRSHIQKKYQCVWRRLALVPPCSAHTRAKGIRMYQYTL